MVWDERIWARRKPTEMSPYVKQLSKEMHNYAESIISSDQAEKLRKHAISLGGLAKIKACIFLAQNQPGIQATPNDFDMNKYLINFANGTIELKTKTLREFRREDMMTKCSKIPYNPIPYPIYQKFLNQIFEGKQDLIRYIRAIFGMCLTGDVSQEQLFIFWGASGGNGKGTLVEFMSYILSDYRVGLPVDALLAKSMGNIPVDIARLKGARLCICNEPDLGMVLSDSKVKQITGKDPFPARFMRENPFDISPTHHTIITSNPKPLLNLADGGMKRRVVLIPFYFSPEPDQIDRHLDDKLKPEAPGVIDWMLDGCMDWLQAGDLNLLQPAEVKESIADYRDEMDPLLEFWNICVEKHPGAMSPNSLLYAIYRLWCEAAEIHAKGSKGFTQLLYNSGFRKADGRIDGKMSRAVTGIRPTQKALEIITRYNTNPTEEHGWAVDQFKQWDSWRPITEMQKIQEKEATDAILKEIKKEFGAGKPTTHEVNTYLKIQHEEIDDDERENIVIAYCTWDTEYAKKIYDLRDAKKRLEHGVTGQDQRGKLRELRDIIRSSQNGNGADIGTIVSKANAYGITKENTEDMLSKLKSAGEVIEASNNRYRVV